MGNTPVVLYKVFWGFSKYFRKITTKKKVFMDGFFLDGF
jgi:hypothetical protein